MALGLVTVLVAVLGDDAMRDYGWRIPFLIGALGALVAWWIRRGTEETLDDTAGAGATSKVGIFEALRKHPKESLQVFGVTAGIGVGQYFWATYFPTYATINGGFSTSTATTVSLVGLSVYVVATPLLGMVSDRVGRKPMLVTFAVGLAAVVTAWS